MLNIVKNKISILLTQWPPAKFWICYDAAMNKFINKALSHDCRLWAGLFSLLLSFLLSYNTLVNPDGALYLESAKFISEGQWLAGLKTYYWIFYATAIAGTSYLTTLPLEQSAFLLNAISYVLLVTGFITLVKVLGGDTRVQWLAAAVILVHPSLNGYRDYIVRDFGLWAFMLWALYFLIKYAQQAQYRYVIGWTISIMLALLFRIEAILLVILAPLGFYACMPEESFKQKTLYVIKAQSLLIIALAAALIALSVTNNMHYLGRANDLPKYFNFLLFKSFDIYQQKAIYFSEGMSVFFKPKHGLVALFGALLTYSLYLIIKLLSPLYTLLAGYGMFRKAVPNNLATRMVAWFIIILAIGLLGHLLRSFFFSSRYLVPPVLLLMLWVPFAIDALLILGKKYLLIIVALLMTYMFFDGVITTGYSKMYIKDAGQWLKENEPNAIVFTNNRQVAYYADLRTKEQDFSPGSDIRLLQSDGWQAYDYLALRHTRRTTELNEMIAKLPDTVIVQEYYNKRGDGVVIIKVLR
jgi:hypothetical protein